MKKKCDLSKFWIKTIKIEIKSYNKGRNEIENVLKSVNINHINIMRKEA